MGNHSNVTLHNGREERLSQTLCNPETSIVVPVYNAEKYLRQCVESVLAQNYSDWELILVDDGSTDGSALICDEYATLDPRIHVVHTPNGGFSAARNTGLNNIRGKYITFLDADDLLHPQFLQLATEAIAEKNTDIVSFYYTRDLRGFEKRIGVKTDFKEISGKDFIENILYQNSKSHPSSMWGKLYKRELLSEIRFTPSIGYEDLDYLYRLLPRVSKVAVSQLKLYYYRPNPTSYIHTFTGGRRDVLDVTDRMKIYFSKSGGNPNGALFQAAKDRSLSANFNILALMTANNYVDSGLESRCWATILQERKNSLFNPRVRLKNKLAILLTYLGGRPIFRILSRLFYK